MSNVIVKSDRYTVDPLYQWDLNQDLVIYGLSLASIPEIHFTNSIMDRAVVRQAQMNDAGVITVGVPNSLLQKPYIIKAYVCIYEGETFKSLYCIDIPVKGRTKPSDYILEDDPEVYSFNALENLVNNTCKTLTLKCDNTIETVNEGYNKAITDLNEKCDNTIETVNEIADNAKNSLNDKCIEAINTVNQTSAEAVETITNKANENLESISNTNERVTALETPTFTQATSRTNIASGNTMPTILGKIMKYFTDLKTHAFNTPANNLTTTSEGYALDARQGKTLNDNVTGIKNNYLSGNYTGMCHIENMAKVICATDVMSIHPTHKYIPALNRGQPILIIGRYSSGELYIGVWRYKNGTDSYPIEKVCLRGTSPTINGHTMYTDSQFAATPFTNAIVLW